MLTLQVCLLPSYPGESRRLVGQRDSQFQRLAFEERNEPWRGWALSLSGAQGVDMLWAYIDLLPGTGPQPLAHLQAAWLTAGWLVAAKYNQKD